MAVPTPKDWPLSTPVILLGHQSDYSNFRWGASCHGHAGEYEHRAPAICHVMNRFLNHQALPDTMCTNCWTHHRGLCECPDPERDHQSLIDAVTSLPPTDKRFMIYERCKTCSLLHPPSHTGCPGSS